MVGMLRLGVFSVSDPLPLYVCESHYYTMVSRGKVRDYVPVYNYDGLHCFFKECHSRVFRKILAGDGDKQTKKVFVFGDQVVEERVF